MQIWQKKHVNYDKFESATKKENSFFLNPNAFFFFFLTSALLWYHAIYIVNQYFALYTGYEGEIFEVISNLYVQESKFGGNIYKFGVKSKN